MPTNATRQRTGSASRGFVRVSLFWDAIRSSYWFVPGLLILLGAGSALFLVYTDRKDNTDALTGLWWIFSGGADGARTVLSTIAGGVISVTGTTFSITIAVLSLTSSQFGPRLLRGFLRDTGNQIVLGTFLATFLYCLLVLRTIRSVEENSFVPHLAVTIGVAFAIASVCVLIYFIHHVSTSIQANRIIAGVAGELEACIARLFPQEIGTDSKELPASAREDDHSLLQRLPYVVRASATGYVQAVDSDAVFALAKERRCVIDLQRAPGEFVVANTTLAHIYPAPTDASDKAQVSKDTNDVFVIGSQRTATQDIEFLFLQLVEVAARALSPGINDPFTAILCMDRLSAAFCGLAGRTLPSAKRRDAEGRTRVIARPVSFAGLLPIAFGEIVFYGSGDPLIVARLFYILGDIGDCACAPAQRDALREQAALVREAALVNAADLPSRRAAVEEQYSLTMRRLAASEPQRTAA